MIARIATFLAFAFAAALLVIAVVAAFIVGPPAVLVSRFWPRADGGTR